MVARREMLAASVLSGFFAGEQIMQTQLILRPDTVANFIGTPYDNR